MAEETRRLDQDTTRLSEERTHRTEQSTLRLSGLGLSPEALVGGRYRVLRQLDSGGESDVYLSEDTETPGTRVIVKIYRHSVRPDREVLERLRGLRHTDILSVLAIGEIEDRLYEITEYAAGGSLEGQQFDEDTLRRSIIPQVTNALEYCHSQGILHRDLKPSNLFFRDAERIDLVVADFGLSSMVLGDEGVKWSSRVGFTLTYAAPELYGAFAPESRDRFRGATVSIANEGTERLGERDRDRARAMVVGREADWYAFGMTVLVLLWGQDPLANFHAAYGLRLKSSGDVPLPDCSPRFEQLFRGLLHPDWEERWGLDEVRRWLAGEDVAVAQISATTEPFRYPLAEDLVAQSREELAYLLVEHPELAADHVEGGILDRYMAQRDPALAVTVRKIRNAAPHTRAAVIQLAHTLDSNLLYRLLPGREAGTPEELASLIDAGEEAWAAGREQLFAGLIPAWLRALGYESTVKQWETEASKYEDAQDLDGGLERFLHMLDPELPLPTLRVSEPKLQLGSIEIGKRAVCELRIQNAGRGYLAGTVELETPLTGVSVAPPTFQRNETTVRLSVNTAGLTRGRRYESNLLLTSNAGPPVHVPVSFRVGFPLTPVLQYVFAFGVAGALLALIYRVFVGTMQDRTPSSWLSGYFPTNSWLSSEAIDSYEPYWEFTVLPIGLGVAVWLLIRAWRRTT